MQITTGKIESAQKVLIYGPEGIGKSQLAALFPDPLFIDVEGSTKHMDVKRLPNPESWTMLLEDVRYVILNPDVCRTLVIDTADWAEGLCIHQVCAKAQVNGIEDFGYGKGYTYLAEEFGALLNLLSDVIEKGVHVVLTAHATIRKFEQPDEMAAYDRWELKLQKKTAPLVKEWSDMVLFANYQTIVVKSEGTKTAKGQGGKRVLYTAHRAAWDAKNRHDLPEEIPFEGVKTLPKPLAAVIPTLVKPGVAAPAQAAPAAPAPTPAPTTTAATPGVPVAALPHLAPLLQLMQQNGVTDEQIRAVVAGKGYFPLATPIENYPADFVDGVLVSAWPQVLSVINASKQTTLDTPFDN